jgi:hypothetical protein
MALPATPTHTEYVERIADALSTMASGVFWVDGEGDVQLGADWSL